ncbi:Putative NADPH-quinone reductase (modulator of drug activity B) [Pseudovibrio ascidiaceicola]|uniref:NADPH-quinone reductase (Modulator of drug activity B) n=1 Tax=Pseudovibrio ascidiaceicola TaxID=285279 RepID=A0A1I3ZGK3_9HYPH|nr:NAD(P)H-dependent oxidoreductase [Pseudovibrio ascidiaceicola]SFK42841.1 Putative NADPH-quinone reductase (modulator of drug activity B) [Pseudovibrio ascidiaceicola]
MKILVLTAHPDLNKSRINRSWFKAFAETDDITVLDLTRVGGPTMSFNVEEQQQLLLSHDRIVFQFPFYWYSAPPVLKAWQDQVLTYGFAYGPGSKKLVGRELVLAISTGGPEDSYHAGGYNNFSMDELLKPFQQTALMTGMTYLRPFVFHGLAVVAEAAMEASIATLLAHIQDPELNPLIKKARMDKLLENDAELAARVSA